MDSQSQQFSLPCSTQYYRSFDEIDEPFKKNNNPSNHGTTTTKTPTTTISTTQMKETTDMGTTATTTMVEDHNHHHYYDHDIDDNDDVEYGTSRTDNNNNNNNNKTSSTRMKEENHDYDEVGSVQDDLKQHDANYHLTTTTTAATNTTTNSSSSRMNRFFGGNRRKDPATTSTTTTTTKSISSQRNNKNKNENNNLNHHDTIQQDQQEINPSHRKKGEDFRFFHSHSNQQQQQERQRKEVCRYRGFSTSIRDMFMYNDQVGSNSNNTIGGDSGLSTSSSSSSFERIDCCSITCCGILQSDRDRYLLYGVKPPNFFRRCTIHIIFPLTIFCTAGFCAMRIEPRIVNEITCTILLLVLVAYCMLQCYKGSEKRKGIRRNLLYTKYQILVNQQQQQNENEQDDDNNNHQDDEKKRKTSKKQKQNRNSSSHNNGNEEKEYLMGQLPNDIRMAHPCCFIGCYPDDYDDDSDDDDDHYQMEGEEYNLKNNCNNMIHNDDNDVENHQHILLRRNTRQGNYGVAYFLNKVLNPTCGCCCCPKKISSCCRSSSSYNIQCCGVCAIAQEGREIEHILLPLAYRCIDYITMEPYVQYYPPIYQYQHQYQQQIQQIELLPNRQIKSLPPPPATTTTTITVPFLPPLSRLSYKLVQTLLLFLLLILIWIYVSPYYWYYVIGRPIQTIATANFFHLEDYYVLIATFGHSILLLSTIVYITNNIVKVNTPLTTTTTTTTTTTKKGITINDVAEETSTIIPEQPEPVSSNLSLDAIIKFFASGFFLSASLAFFWEVIAVLIVNVFVTLLLTVSGIRTQMDPSRSSSSSSNYDDYYTDDIANGSSSRGSSWFKSTTTSTNHQPNGGRGSFLPSYHLTHIMGSTIENSPLREWFFPSSSSAYNMDMDSSSSSSSSSDYVTLFGMDHPILYTLYLAFGAFFVAAVIEELCKYYGYRMAEGHPDFLSSKELHDAIRVAQQQSIRQNNGGSGGGRRLRLEYSSDDDEDDDEEEQNHYHRSDNKNINDDDEDSYDDHYVVPPDATTNTNNNNNNNELSLFSFPNQLSSLQGHGAAITLAMVATAIGFSCCENLIYVFVYAGGSGVGMEWGVLIERMFFPLHPIVAAVQSIGIVQNQLITPRVGNSSGAVGHTNHNNNNNNKNSLGRVLLPAILIHGSFDFFILWIDFLGKLVQGGNNNNNGGDNVGIDGDLRITNTTELLSVLSCITIMGIGLLYLHKKSQEQRQILAALDHNIQKNKKQNQQQQQSSCFQGQQEDPITKMTTTSTNVKSLHRKQKMAGRMKDDDDDHRTTGLLS